MSSTVLWGKSNPELRFNDVSKSKGFIYEGTMADNLSYKPRLAAPALLDNQGVFVADFNNDNWPDIFSLGGKNPTLFRNQGGLFLKHDTFPRITQKISSAGWADVNNDGWTDLILVPRVGSLRVHINEEGKLGEVKVSDSIRFTEASGIALGDYNRDNCVDVFVIQYGKGYEHDSKKQKNYRLGRSVKLKGTNDNGEANYLMEGDCHGRFEVKKSSSFRRTHWSLAASMVDFTGNGYLDIHIANDFFRDSLYKNRGNGQFEHTYLPQSTNRNGMASQVLDVNNDRRPDIIVSNIFLNSRTRIMRWDWFKNFVTSTPKGHNLLVNKGDGRFVDRASKYDVRKGGWGWAATRGDYDNDFDNELIMARQDLLALGGTTRNFVYKKKAVQDFIQANYRSEVVSDWSRTHNEFFEEFQPWLGWLQVWDQNNGIFQEQPTSELGLVRVNARGIVSLDFDRDGRLDLAVSQLDGPYKLFQNVGRSKSMVKVSVEDQDIGGMLEVKNKTRKEFIPVSMRTDFHSQESPFYHVGLGENNSLDSITMNWNDGTVQKVKDVEAGEFISFNKPNS